MSQWKGSLTMERSIRRNGQGNPCQPTTSLDHQEPPLYASNSVPLNAPSNSRAPARSLDNFLEPTLCTNYGSCSAAFCKSTRGRAQSYVPTSRPRGLLCFQIIITRELQKPVVTAAGLVSWLAWNLAEPMER